MRWIESRNGWYIALILLVLVSSYLRLETAGQRPIWYDETYTRALANLDSIAEIRARSRSDWAGESPPLHYILCFLHFQVEKSLLSLRLPSVEAGVLTVLGVAVLGALMFSRLVGLVAGILMAFSVYHIEYSQDARGYSLMLLTMVMTLLCLFAFLRSGHWRWAFGFAAAGAAAVYTHFVAPVLHLCIVLTLLGILTDRYRRYRRGELGRDSWLEILKFSLFGYAAVGLLVLPLARQFLGFLNRSVPPGSHVLDLSPRFVLELLGRWGNGSEWSIFYAACLLTGIIACLRRRDASLVLLLWFASPFVIFSLVPEKRIFDIRYLIGSLPGFFLLAGLGLVTLASAVQSGLARWVSSETVRRIASREALVAAFTLFFTVLSVDTYMDFRQTMVRCSQFAGSPRILERNDGFCEKHLILNTFHPPHAFIRREVEVEKRGSGGRLLDRLFR
jgi:4-amino-4-deoxy-L-arabinose transferase-like glycosyltransferase